MSVLVVVALGAAGAAALVGAAYALVPAPPSLEEELERLRRVPRPAPPPPESGAAASWAMGLGPPLRRWCHRFGMDLPALEPDLRLVGRPLEYHLGAKAIVALVGLLLPAVVAVLVRAGAGAGIAPHFAALAAVALAVVGFVAPDLVLRIEAARRRRSFTTAFGTFLDMTTVSLAGGVGVEGALLDAARIGRGREAGVLRAVLEESLWSGESQWSALSRLGVELDLPDLVEAASSVALAGTEGARIRRSLEAKARGVRARQLAEAEAAAAAATERMAIPTALLLLAFTLLIGYPALDSIVGSL